MYGKGTAGSQGELFACAPRVATTEVADPRSPREPALDGAEDPRLGVLQAVLCIVAVSGYDALSMSTILTTSGVARRDFNQWFRSPEDAFVAAHDRCMDQLVDAVRTALASAETVEQAVRRGVRAAVDYLVADPARADVLLLQVHVAGDRTMRSQEAGIEALVALVQAVLMRAGLPSGTALRVARHGVGGFREVARARAARGELHALADVAWDLAEAAFPLRSLAPDGSWSAGRHGRTSD